MQATDKIPTDKIPTHSVVNRHIPTTDRDQQIVQAADRINADTNKLQAINRYQQTDTNRYQQTEIPTDSAGNRQLPTDSALNRQIPPDSAGNRQMPTDSAGNRY